MTDSRNRPDPRRLRDVAELAGVSLATVDRVLNERGNVSFVAAQRVIAAARKVGLKRVLPPIYRGGIRIDVILQGSRAAVGRLNQGFIDAASRLSHSVTIQRKIGEWPDPTEIATKLRESATQGIIIACQEHPAIVDAIAAVTAAGKPVVAVRTDIPSSTRFAYVGVDHYQAGRTAAFFTARMTPRCGRVIVVAGNLAEHDQAGRVAGFRDGLRLHGPEMRLGAVLQFNEGSEPASAHLSAALSSAGRPVDAIYNASSENRGVEDALRTTGLLGQGAWVGHGLTDQTSALLEQGFMSLVLEEHPELQAERAVDVLLTRLGYYEEHERPDLSADLPMSVYGPENLPRREAPTMQTKQGCDQ